MKISAEYVPEDDLIVTVVNGFRLTVPVLLQKGKPVKLSLSHIDTPWIELEGWAIRPLDES